jgi:hypothetical protein
VGAVEGVSDLGGNGQERVEWKGTALKALGESLSFEVLHHEKVCAFVAADIVKRADVGVREGRNGAGLALEPPLTLGIGAEGFREDLDGDGAVEAGVAGAINLPHPACAET